MTNKILAFAVLSTCTAMALLPHDPVSHLEQQLPADIQQYFGIIRVHGPNNPQLNESGSRYHSLMQGDFYTGPNFLKPGETCPSMSEDN